MAKKTSLELLSPKYIDSEGEEERSGEGEEQVSEVLERFQSPFEDLRNGFLNEPVVQQKKSFISELNVE